MIGHKKNVYIYLQRNKTISSIQLIKANKTYINTEKYIRPLSQELSKQQNLFVHIYNRLYKSFLPRLPTYL